MDYEKMLERTYASLPKQALTKERFELPTAESHIQGNKTVIKNFSQLLKIINRPEKHIFKFITKETATAATIGEGKLILNGKFSNEQVNSLFKNYIEQFLLCHECKKPDTRVVEQRGIKVLKCDACGASSPLKRI